MKRKKVLVVLNYYIPYISGVTEYARLAAEKLVEDGYDVTVLTSNHANLAKEEMINGVRVIRAKVLFRISKGTVSLEYMRLARKLAKEADVVNMHCPMLESGWISLFIPKNKLVTMYHCDVNLPKTLLNQFIVKVMDVTHRVCLSRSKRIIVTSIDYAEHSRVTSKYVSKLAEAAAPVKEYTRVEGTGSDDKKVIGFCGRIVEEKGIDVLVKAYQLVKQQVPDAVLKIAGDYKGVAGGSVYGQLMEYISANQVEGVEFLGKIPESEMAAFFSGLDVFVLPSINSLEAFGMVQVEAMRCGAPVVASDLYGVRTIVQNTGAGLIAHARDVSNLAECIIRVLENASEYMISLEELDKIYGNHVWFEKYKSALFS